MFLLEGIYIPSKSIISVFPLRWILINLLFVLSANISINVDFPTPGLPSNNNGLLINNDFDSLYKFSFIVYDSKE